MTEENNWISMDTALEIVKAEFNTYLLKYNFIVYDIEDKGRYLTLLFAKKDYLSLSFGVEDGHLQTPEFWVKLRQDKYSKDLKGFKKIVYGELKNSKTFTSELTEANVLDFCSIIKNILEKEFKDYLVLEYL